MMTRRGWLRMLAREALAEQRGRCIYCKSPLCGKDVTAEHKWPQSKGGGDTRENIAAACYDCNVVKGSKTHVEFYKLIDRGELPRGARSGVLLIWASRRIFRRADRACARIEKRAR